jgi:hypothetical protein
MPETPGQSDLPPLADRLDAILAALAGAMVADDWAAAKLAMHVLADLTAEVRAAESRERAEPTEAANS